MSEEPKAEKPKKVVSIIKNNFLIKYCDRLRQSHGRW